MGISARTQHSDWTHQDWMHQKHKYPPLLIPLSILLMLRAIVFLGLSGLCIYLAIQDLTSSGGYFKGIFVLAILCLVIFTAFIVFDILSFVKLLRNKRSGKILTTITSTGLITFFVLLIVFESEAVFFVIPLGFNLAILILSILIKLNPTRFSTQLAQPIFEQNYPAPTEYVYPSQSAKIYPAPTEYKYQKPESPEHQEPNFDK